MNYYAPDMMFKTTEQQMDELMEKWNKRWVFGNACIPPERAQRLKPRHRHPPPFVSSPNAMCERCRRKCDKLYDNLGGPKWHGGMDRPPKLWRKLYRYFLKRCLKRRKRYQDAK